MSGTELFDRLRQLDLPSGDFAVFGSGPLLVRGVIDDVGDLDVVCRGAAWERAAAIGEPHVLEDGAVVVAIDGGALTFGRSWRYGTVDVGVLIDTADMIEGLPFVRLEHVIEFKRIADRPKDRRHLAALRAAGLAE